MPGAVPAKKRPARRKAVAPLPVAEAAAGREARSPMHARGKRRVDAILDAASAILMEDGPEALSIEAIAKRSETSKSSMYHFFRDLDCVIGALAQRHIGEFIRIETEMLSSDIEWASLSADVVVDRYLAPITQYLADHPDMLVVMHLGGPRIDAVADESGVKGLHIARAERILQARHSGVRPVKRHARAATMVGTVMGCMEILTLVPVDVQTSMFRELRGSLVAYIESLDARSTRR